jgi:hypothetical protein
MVFDIIAIFIGIIVLIVAFWIINQLKLIMKKQEQIWNVEKLNLRLSFFEEVKKVLTLPHDDPANINLKSRIGILFNKNFENQYNAIVLLKNELHKLKLYKEATLQKLKSSYPNNLYTDILESEKNGFNYAPEEYEFLKKLCLEMDEQIYKKLEYRYLVGLIDMFESIIADNEKKLMSDMQDFIKESFSGN